VLVARDAVREREDSSAVQPHQHFKRPLVPRLGAGDDVGIGVTHGCFDGSRGRTVSALMRLRRAAVRPSMTRRETHAAVSP